MYGNLNAYNYGTLKGNVKGCEKGNAKACNDLAGMYLSGESKFNLRENKTKAKEFYDKSLSLYENYCEEGDAKACFDLGDKYNGMRWGIEQDYKTMMKYYTKSCEYGYGFACNELGAAYKRGNGVIKDEDMSKMYFDQALEFYEKECANDIAASCKRLGMIYKAEMYGTNDPGRAFALEKKAFNLFKKLCDSDDSEGCFQVATSYYIGAQEAIKINWSKAKKYYKKSCDLGESSACWREKEIDPNEQIKYEKKIEYSALDQQYRSIDKREEERWFARAKRQREQLDDSNLTASAKEALLKKMEAENILWIKESRTRIEKEKMIIEKKKKEIEAFLR